LLLLVTANLLIGPDHLFKGKGNLLPCLELDDVGYPLLLDRRQLDELDQAGLTRNGNGHLASLQLVSFQEGLEGLADELIGIGVGLAEDLGVLDVVERLGADLIRALAGDQLECLECGLTNIEGPYGLTLRHRGTSPVAPGNARSRVWE